MNRDKPTTKGEAQGAARDPSTGAPGEDPADAGAGEDSHPAAQEREDGSDNLAAAPDHDVPNEEVIKKTLPETNHDKQ